MSQRLILLLALLFLSACAPRQILLPAVGIELPPRYTLPADFPPLISHETGEPMPGFGGEGGGLTRTPVLFIHGNTVSAGYWLPTRAHFLDAGYTEDETWALGYGWNNVRYFDAADLSVPSVERIVNGVRAYLEERTGQPVPQVDVIGHSLGVTLVRQWMMQTNSWHKVRNFIGACGANAGVWTASADTRGQQRPVAWELYPGSPWLEQLSRQGETPGPTRYMTLYDGTGWGDVLFPPPFEDSSALDGAFNLAYNREQGTYYGHLNLPWEAGPAQAMLDFLAAAPKPEVQETAPEIAIEANLLSTTQPDAKLHCTDDGRYPTRATPGVAELQMQPDKLYSCFARHPQTHLASALHRYKAYTEPDFARTPPRIWAEPAGGVFEQPQNVRLYTDDPDAFIVYTTAGVTPSTGSPLYTDPVFVAAPLQLQAIAVTPGGVSSEPLILDFDISLEFAEARHTLQRQFDPDAPLQYRGQRKKGN